MTTLSLSKYLDLNPKANSDINSPYNYSSINQTVDTNVTTGSTYYYAVRSIHEYGITSNISTILEVTIPFPSPPAPITGLVVGC